MFGQSAVSSGPIEYSTLSASAIIDSLLNKGINPRREPTCEKHAVRPANLAPCPSLHNNMKQLGNSRGTYGFIQSLIQI